MHVAIYNPELTSDSQRRRPSVAILGIRGVPAGHGGFETFAARLAPELAAGGWDVVVYCQEEEAGPAVPAGRDRWYSIWEGVRRIHIVVGPDTPLNSIKFDIKCVNDAAARRPDVVLILGYNTAVFALKLRLKGIPVVFNMDGIEWQRDKWGAAARAWLYMNDWSACLLASHLIADHPEIERHLLSRTKRRRISVIPYGADAVDADSAKEPPSGVDLELLRSRGLEPGRYATLIARAEPENSVLEIVRAFSSRPRGIKLAVLGSYEPRKVPYHAKVLAAAGPEVIFLGAIYESAVVRTLRLRGVLYLHGHRVGGCNPSLLEAMGAGNAVLAHANRFNAWVAGAGAAYFASETECAQMLDALLGSPSRLRELGAFSRRRAAAVFNWGDVLQSYGQLLADTRSDAADAAKAHKFSWGRRPQWQLDGDAR
jgi:glycosyltransferase involved in cell wall biosynthesis